MDWKSQSGRLSVLGHKTSPLPPVTGEYTCMQVILSLCCVRDSKVWSVVMANMEAFRKSKLMMPIREHFGMRRCTSATDVWISAAPPDLSDQRRGRTWLKLLQHPELWIGVDVAQNMGDGSHHRELSRSAKWVLWAA
jgi:hypothetical protein